MKTSMIVRPGMIAGLYSCNLTVAGLMLLAGLFGCGPAPSDHAPNRSPALAWVRRPNGNQSRSTVRQ